MSRMLDRNGVAKVRADHVRVEDVLDFQGDQYADPETFANPDNFEPEPGSTADGFRYEGCRVTAITHEKGPDGPTIVIHTEDSAFGFPADHEIEIMLGEGLTPDLRSRNDCGKILHDDDYRHTAFNRYARLTGKRGKMDWATIENDGDDHWIVYQQ